MQRQHLDSTNNEKDENCSFTVTSNHQFHICEYHRWIAVGTLNSKSCGFSDIMCDAWHLSFVGEDERISPVSWNKGWINENSLGEFQRNWNAITIIIIISCSHKFQKIFRVQNRGKNRNRASGGEDDWKMVLGCMRARGNYDKVESLDRLV